MSEETTIQLDFMFNLYLNTITFIDPVRRGDTHVQDGFSGIEFD